MSLQPAASEDGSIDGWRSQQIRRSRCLDASTGRRSRAHTVETAARAGAGALEDEPVVVGLALAEGAGAGGAALLDHGVDGGAPAGPGGTAVGRSRVALDTDVAASSLAGSR